MMKFDFNNKNNKESYKKRIKKKPQIICPRIFVPLFDESEQNNENKETII